MNKKMKKNKSFINYLILLLAVFAISMAFIGCNMDPKTEGPPAVSSTAPADEAADVRINADITATFSEEMDSTTIDTDSFTLYEGTTQIPGTVSYEGSTKTASFNPDASLETETLYTATITTGVKDAADTPMAQDKVWTFTTEGPPVVSSTVPADDAADVGINTNITATFSKEMDSTTINTDSFTLYAGTTIVSGTVSYDATNVTASFNPAANLATGTTYTATIATGVTDAAGTAMAQNKVWTFTTVAAANLEAGASGGPGTVDLGSAANYAILAKTGVSTTGTTMVTGDIGLSPASRTELTGFSETMDSSGTFSTSSYVTGNLYAADYTDPTPATLTTAISDMELAYTTAAGLSDPDFINLGAGEIGGLTLEPGLYKWGTGVNMSTDVTIWGSDTATWVFQIAEDLVVANGAKITLAGGALAKNIVWQVGSQATLGTTSHLEGIVLAQTAIPVNTGASINGRLLAQSAVTLDANNVTQP